MKIQNNVSVCRKIVLVDNKIIRDKNDLYIQVEIFEFCSFVFFPMSIKSLSTVATIVVGLVFLASNKLLVDKQLVYHPDRYHGTFDD